MDNWADLKNECSSCRRCPLAESRTNLVFGTGNPEAEVMLIGEGPGEQEDLQGVPFVGPAGKLLDTMLELIGLDRTKVYIANIVKCRPPHNRDPKPEEKELCSEWLMRQISLVKPKVIVCLGRIAAGSIISEDYRITRQHGEWTQIGDCKVTAIYHPSALLRDESKRPETFEDLRSIRAQIRACCSHTYEK